VDLDLRLSDMRDFALDEPAALIYCPFADLSSAERRGSSHPDGSEAYSRSVGDEDFTGSEEPFAATPGNLEILRNEAAALLRAAAADPARAELYGRRAAWLGRMADRLEQRINAT